MVAEFGFSVTKNKMPRPTKYRAKRTEIDGIVFASQKEARRYQDLKLLERAGEITQLTLQPTFPIVINGVKVCKYVADFQYVEFGSNEVIVEDCKGFPTPVYKLKKKLVKAIHNVDIRET